MTHVYVCKLGAEKVLRISLAFVKYQGLAYLILASEGDKNPNRSELLRSPLIFKWHRDFQGMSGLLQMLRIIRSILDLEIICIEKLAMNPIIWPL